MASVDWQWQDVYPNKTTRNQLETNPVNQNISDSELDFEDQNFEGLYSRIKKHTDVNTNTLRDAYSVYKDKQYFPTSTRLDFLLPEPHLVPGCLTLLEYADKNSRSFVIQLFIRLMLKYYEQGVLFIDCTYIFPAYELIEATIDYNPLIDPQLPIRAIQLSRSFNYHQTTETIKQQLEPQLREGFYYNVTDSLAEKQEKKFVKPKIVIVAGLPDLYLNKESAQYLEYDGRPPWWSIFELQETIGYLRSLTLKYDCITIISSALDPRSKIKPLGGRFLGQSAGVIVKIVTEGLELNAELIKHPFIKERTIPVMILKKKGKKRATMPLKYFL